MALQGKVAIITGASSGIGAGIAEHFAKEGAKLSLTGRSVENLEAVAKKCRENAAENVITTIGDITSESTRQILVKTTLDSFSKIDILVNNAGIGSYSPMIAVTPEHYDGMMNVNLRTPVLLTALAAPHLIESKGCILNISSAASTTAPPMTGVYSMTKAALDTYTKVLARELGPQGVRVNSLNPGFVDTPMLYQHEDKELVQQTLDSIRKNTPIGRLGSTGEAAEIAAFIVSDKASFITGSNIVADGGLWLMPGY